MSSPENDQPEDPGFPGPPRWVPVQLVQLFHSACYSGGRIAASCSRVHVNNIAGLPFFDGNNNW